VALARASDDVAHGPMAIVPPHLRDGHYPGSAALGHAVSYVYPHDDPNGWVAQQYLPDELGGRRYYEPSEHGREAHALDWRRRAAGEGGGTPAPR
jgi:putative ATPase